MLLYWPPFLTPKPLLVEKGLEELGEEDRTAIVVKQGHCCKSTADGT